ncbi:OmpA family protein [Porphyrobacter sp. GA68]|uniref:OmpA family protein n=1 Tax=Porphyrobacter sp. GA68 TaxID=2883480 RepID=UPI001D18FE69|nr:OmpA family protein [Porphyrobacter sp. GA68]
MTNVPRKPTLVLAAMLALPLTGGVAAQDWTPPGGADPITVTGTLPDLSQMSKGPQLQGIISARRADQVQVVLADGSRTAVTLTGETRIRSSGGFLGLHREQLAAEQLLNGLPVTIDTLEWEGGLVASQIALKTRDLRTASMIRTGTEQGFAEQTAATEALRGRLGDIDKYNLKGTTNVNFDTAKWNLSEQDKGALCAAAQRAEAMENSLLLVVGYTDSVGDEDYNQELSEKRASRVVNHLQQQCGWKPYRMLTPTGMAEADPLADNSTEEGKAQNRRVAVNILVSKSVDGM